MAAAPMALSQASQSQGSSTKIKITTHRGPVYDIDAEGCVTWGDLKDELRQMGSDPNSGETKIWDDASLGLFKVDPTGKKSMVELKDTDRIEFGTTVDLRLRPIGITVKDDGHSELLVVDKTITVKTLHEFFAQKRSERKSGAANSKFGGDENVEWTYRGRKLHASDRLSDLNIPAAGAEFHGRFRITVTDKACGLDDALVANDSWTLEYLRAAYNEKRKRLVLPNASWTIGPGEPLEEDDHARADKKGPAVDEKLSLYDQQIGEEATIRFENPPFALTFRESGSALADAKAELYGSAKRPDNDNEPFVVSEVRDEWTVEHLKAHFNEHYAKTAPQYLGEDDRLVLRLKRNGEETELEPGKFLWKYVHLAADGAEVLIKREQLQQSSVRYICADCGEDVRLKKGDEVRCRQCGYRIVYKKRTTNPCQYLAR